MSNTLRNRGLAGPVLDATNAGLVRAEGPCVWFNGPPSAAGQALNHLRRTVSFTAPVDASFTYAFDLTMEWLPTAHTCRFSDESMYSSFNGVTGDVAFSFYGEDSSFPGINTTQAQIAAVLPGLSQGDRIQIQFKWDTTTDTLSFSVRDASLGLRCSDPAGWLLARSVVAAGKAFRSSSAVAPRINNAFSGTYAYFGIVYGWHLKVGDVVQGDVGPEVLTNAATDASTIVDSAGVSWTVGRSSTGPSTTIVPSGVELINPDPTTTVAANLPADAGALGFGASDDVLVAWVGKTGNDPIVTAYPFCTEGTITAGAAGFYSDGTGRVGFAGNDVPAYATRTWTPTSAQKWATLAHFVRISRGTGLLSYQIYDAAGVSVYSSSVAMPAGAGTSTLAATILKYLPGSFRQAMFRKGPGIAPEYTDTDLAALAAYLLEHA